jgi:hypothetical protein
MNAMKRGILPSETTNILWLNLIFKKFQGTICKTVYLA